MKSVMNYKNNHCALIYVKKLFLNSNLVNTSIPEVIPEIILDDIHLVNSLIVMPKSL